MKIFGIHCCRCCCCCCKIDSRCWLVEQHDIGRADERNGHAKLALVAAAQRVAPLVGVLVEVEQRNERNARAMHELASQTPEVGVEPHVLVDGEAVDERVHLWTIAELVLKVGRRAAQAHAVEVGVAARHHRVAGQHAKGGRLAGAVDAEQTKALAAPQAHAQTFDGHEVQVIMLADTMQHEHVVTGGRRRRRRRGWRSTPVNESAVAVHLVDAVLFVGDVHVAAIHTIERLRVVQQRAHAVHTPGYHKTTVSTLILLKRRLAPVKQTNLVRSQ